jgi:hypothetical protein
MSARSPGTVSLFDPHSDRFLAGVRSRLDAAAAGLADCRLVILAVVAHPDDEAIGPGGTLATLARQAHAAVFLVVVAAEDPVRRQESRRAAEVLGLPPERVFLFDFPDGGLSHHDGLVRRLLRLFAEVVSPDLVLTHKEDAHPDHTVLCGLVRQVFARHGASILHFRIPQPVYSPWHPVVWFRVAPEAARLKLGELFAAYPTENWKDYFDPVMNEGILAEAGHAAGSRSAEPFEAARVVLSPCPCGCGVLALARHPGRSPAGGSDGQGGAAALPLTPTRLVLAPCPCGCGAVAVARSAARR